MRREFLAPASTDRNRLRVHAVDEMHLVALPNALLNISVDPLRPHSIDNSPEEPAVRPPLEVELLVRQVGHDRRVIAHERPGPLYGVLGQVLPDSAALTDFVAGEGPLGLLENLLQETHASIFCLGEPDVDCHGQRRNTYGAQSCTGAGRSYSATCGQAHRY